MTLASDDVAPGVVRFERVLPTGWSLSMLLVRLPGGGVLVHSPTWLGDETFAAVEAVGTPRALFAPNHFHHLSLERFRKRYPDAPAIASRQAKKRLATQGHQGLAPLSDAAAMLPAGARFLECEGTKSGEAWLLLPAAGGAKTGGTLIVSDAFFNVTRDVTGLMGIGLRLLKTCPGLCIGQTFPWLALADRARYRAWADDVFAREQPALLVPSHGEPAGTHAGVPLHERCRALLRERLLGPRETPARRSGRTRPGHVIPSEDTEGSMRMRSFFVVSVGAGLLVLAAACGGSDDDASGTNGGAGSGGSTTGPALAEIPAKLGGAYCALVDQCFGPLKATFLGAEDCATRFTRQFEDGDFPAIKAAVEGGKLTYDASKVQACVDAIAKGGCAQLDNRTPSVCDAVFGGKGAIGDACQTNAECASGTFCEPAAACPGKCAARKASGGACLADDACVDGLKCDATTKTCLAPGKAGEACGGGKPDCGPQLFCVGADESKKQSGTCKTYDEVFSVAEGASCGFTAGPLCKTGACAFDKLVSGQATFKCVPTAASGAACSVALPEQCPVGEYCPVDIQANKLTGTCTKLPKAGEACGKVLFGRQCADYSVCENGTCKETARIGGACALATTCYSGVCTSGACAAGPSCEPKKQ